MWIINRYSLPGVLLSSWEKLKITTTSWKGCEYKTTNIEYTKDIASAVMFDKYNFFYFILSSNLLAFLSKTFNLWNTLILKLK